MRVIVLTVIVAGVCAVRAGGAQEKEPQPRKHPVLAAYELTKKGVISAAELMPEAGYSSRATPEARSFADLIGHSVLTNFGVCAGARREANPKAGQQFEGVVTAKPELVALLKASFEYCDVPFEAAAGPTGTDLTFALSHNARMLGSLELYLRTQGLSLEPSEINKPAAKK